MKNHTMRKIYKHTQGGSLYTAPFVAVRIPEECTGRKLQMEYYGGVGVLQ